MCGGEKKIGLLCLNDHFRDLSADLLFKNRIKLNNAAEHYMEGLAFKFQLSR